METTKFSRIAKIAFLLATSAAIGNVTQAQFLTWSATSTPPSEWLEAGHNVTITSGSVSSWGDARGGINGFAVTGSSGPTQVTGALNGNAVMSFSGSQFLDNTGITGSSLFSGDGQSSTTFIVLNNTGSQASTATAFAWSEGDNNVGHQYLAANTPENDGATVNLTYYQGTANSFIQGPVQPGFNNANQVLTFQRSGSSGLININGSPLTLTASSFADTPNSANSGTATVGALTYNGGQNQFLTGNIAEIVVFNTALSSSDISSVESYLGGKYGISVVPEPSQYATAFSIVCLLGALGLRFRRNSRLAVQN